VKCRFEGSKTSSLTPLPPGIVVTRSDREVSEEDGIRINEFRTLIGSLMYLAHWSRPDIIYAVSLLSSYCQFPGQNHWRGINHILAFLGSTKGRGITYGRPLNGRKNQISGYADADYAGVVQSRRSRTGYITMMNGGALTWKSHLQQRVSQYYSLAECYNEVKWLTQLCLEIDVRQGCVTLCEDIANNPISHPSTKQIEIPS
jgi:hypothetical protein